MVPAPVVTVPMPLTAPSTTVRSNQKAALASFPPQTTNSRLLRSSNHHLFDEPR